jgi:hypothetical protein
VRDPVEHIDERIDLVVEQGAQTALDWYIAACGVMTSGPVDSPGGRAAGLRAFAPVPGLLYFDDIALDLWAWEEALVGLLDAVPVALERLRANEGHLDWTVGRGSMVSWAQADIDTRRERWDELRSRRGVPLPPVWAPTR